jgi:arylsulfatase A-like enzyme
MFSGLRPSSSGVYDNDQGRLPKGNIFERITTLPAYFREHGYLTAGSGKIFASSLGATTSKLAWDETEDAATRRRGHDPLPDKVPLNGIGKHDWGGFPATRDNMEDWQLAGWAADFLAAKHDRPFLLACGIVKPHTPWYVPQPYFDLFPSDRVTIAPLRDDETAGIPKSARKKVAKGERTLRDRRNEIVAAYLAASRYADDCVGRILDALDRSAYRDDTIVVICGDNGYQFGEKNNWSKGKLWEGSTHVPLVFAGPGIVRESTCPRAVSLMDIYPTLVELAGLPTNPKAEGRSLAPLLKDPAQAWDQPVVTTAGFKNHAVRSNRWHYIRYANGAEELYDHEQDPDEHTNLADRADLESVKATLRKSLPTHDEPRIEAAP